MLRFWMYLGSLIIVSSLVSYLVWHRDSLALETVQIEQIGLTERQEIITRYLESEEDGRKLISLAKLLERSQPELVELVAIRAHELLPNSIDATALLARFNSDMEDIIGEIDPLYQN